MLSTRGSMAKKLPPVGKTSILPRMGASPALNVPSSSLVSPSLFGYALASFMILPHGTNAHFGSWIHFMQSLIGARLTLPSLKPLHPKRLTCGFSFAVPVGEVK